MAGKKYLGRGGSLTDRSQLARASIALADKIPIIDISDTTDASVGTQKWCQASDFGLRVFKTSDQSNSSNTTLADVTDLSFAIEASVEYSFRFTLLVIAAATTTGLVVSINGPASPTAVSFSYLSPTSGTAMFAAGATTYDTALVSTGVASTTLPILAQVFGTVRNGSNAGTLTLRMRSEISASNATIMRGSMGELFRIG